MRASYLTHSLNLCAVQDTGDYSTQKTITNDIENVLKALMASGHIHTGHPYQKVIYRDSEGRWHAVEIDEDCRFVRFVPISQSHGDIRDIDPRVLFAKMLLDEVNAETRNGPESQTSEQRP